MAEKSRTSFGKPLPLGSVWFRRLPGGVEQGLGTLAVLAACRDDALSSAAASEGLDLMAWFAWFGNGVCVATTQMTPRALHLRAMPLLAIAAAGCAALGSVPDQSTLARASNETPTPITRDVMPDDRIASAIESALQADPALPQGTIRVSSSGGVVTLSGVVDDQFAAHRTVEVASIVRGVRAIVDLVDVRSFPRTDAELESAVGAALVTDPVVADLRVTAQAQAGLVTLSGRVDSEAAREAAKDDSRAVPGVREVVDRLSMGSATRPSDSHLQDEVSRAIHDDPWIAGARVSAWVDQGIVHLRGQVACYEQFRRAVRDAGSAAPGGIDASGLVIDRRVGRGSALRSAEPVLADADIAEALRHAYGVDPRLQSFVPTVDVNRGVVVLTGLAPNQDAARAAGEDAAHVVGAVGITDRIAVASSSLASEPALRPALTALEGLPGAAAGAANSAPPGAAASTPSVPLSIREARDQSVALYFAARTLRWADVSEKVAALADCIRKIRDDTVNDSASIPRLEGLQASLTEAVKEKDRWTSMIQANELSAALAALAAPYTPGLSVEVHQLDYYGRALQIAEEYRKPGVVRALVDELETRWARVRPELASRDADDTTRFDAAMTRLEHAQSQNELARATDAELAVAYSVRHALSRP